MRTGRAARVLVAAGFGLVSCGDDCPGITSCAIQTAIRVAVTSAATGGPVPNATVEVSGGVVGSTTCVLELGTTVCIVQGFPGQYTLVVRAPGYQTAQRDVTVTGRAGECDCPIVTVENVAIALSSAS